MTTTTNPTGPVRVRRWDDPPPAADPHVNDTTPNEPPPPEPTTDEADAGRGRLFWWAITIPAIVYTTIALAVWSSDANPVTTPATAIVVTCSSALLIALDTTRGRR